MKRKHLYYWSIAVLVGLFTQSYSPIQKQQRKARPPKRYTLQSYEENDFPGYQKRVHALPQYKLWVKRRNNMKLWQNKYVSLHLPDTAVIIDEKVFNTPKGKRTIIAWMTDEDVNYNVYDYEEAYISCPSASVGTGYFYGLLHFTLVNTDSIREINTICVTADSKYDKGKLTYPFSIANPKINHEIYGLVYHANGGSMTVDGAADIMHFVDFNNDGKAYEFALFEVGSCASTESTLIGYNDISDSLKWHSWHLTCKETDHRYADSIYKTALYWVGPTMKTQFDKNGKLNYKIDYRGRGGDLMRYYLRYNKQTDSYSGILDMRQLREDSTGDFSYLPRMEDIKHKRKR